LRSLAATIFAIGNIVFGHFEERTPKWRRVTKVIVFLAVTRLITVQFGRPWSFLAIAIPLRSSSWFTGGGFHARASTGGPLSRRSATTSSAAGRFRRTVDEINLRASRMAVPQHNSDEV
jgi:hypothetical protein